MKRGEVWWATLAGAAGRRPVVLLSRDESYPVRDLVMIAMVTSRVRGIRAELKLGLADGLPHACVANLDTITTVPKNALKELIGTLRQERIREMDDLLHFALGLVH